MRQVLGMASKGRAGLWETCQVGTAGVDVGCADRIKVQPQKAQTEWGLRKEMLRATQDQGVDSGSGSTPGRAQSRDRGQNSSWRLVWNRGYLGVTHTSRAEPHTIPPCRSWVSSKRNKGRFGGRFGNVCRHS